MALNGNITDATHKIQSCMSGAPLFTYLIYTMTTGVCRL